jgi:tRNA pseudouridine38-40 synthase
MNQVFRFHVAYLGQAFSGVQSQQNGRTVQDEIAKAIFLTTQEKADIVIAGRTDAGVHASGQVMSISLNTKLPLRNLTLALQSRLPKDISVWRIDKMPAAFDARRQSVGKHYVYRVGQGIVPSLYWRDRIMHVKAKLNVEAMRHAALALIGEQDFSSFRSTHCQAAHAIRYIWHLEIKDLNELIEIHIKGNAFCLNMVRIIVGTLIEIGLNKRSSSDMAKILLARDRLRAGVTAKAQGLTLERIYYPDDLSNAQIPEQASFPRYPVTLDSWPFCHSMIEYGPT